MLSDAIKCSWCDEDAIGYAFKDFKGVASCGDYGHGFQFELDRALLAEHDRAVAEAAAKQALEDAADDWHAENVGTSPRAYIWLRARAASISTNKAGAGE